MSGFAWIADRQNPDGGWAYGREGSAVEPSVYALLACIAESNDASGESFRRGVRWIVAQQRPDGGWRPRPNVDNSTWVTSLVLLLPEACLGSRNRAAALSWLLSQTGRESSWLERTRLFLLGVHRDVDVSQQGWPWFPDTAAWVSPTAFAILALEKEYRRTFNAAMTRRCYKGREFLMARRCSDGGWNHGASQALGYQAFSYPETTGMALLAFHDVQDTRLDRSLRAAEVHLGKARSVEAASWLRLGLLANGRTVPAEPKMQPRTIQEAALAILVRGAEQGRNVLYQ